MLNSMLSVFEPLLFNPVILVVDNGRPAPAAPNGTELLTGVKAPPLSEISKSDDAILSPAPSVRAAGALLKYAYTVRLRPGLETHAVVAVIPVLPGFEALPAVSAKFTEFPESVSEIDSCSVAFMLMACAPLFSTWADAEVAAEIASRTTAASRASCEERIVIGVPVKKPAS